MMKRHSDFPSAPAAQFRTVVLLPPPLRRLEVGDRSVFLGSCFAESVGAMFAEARLNALVCPLGPVYCPASLVCLMEAEHTREAVEGATGWHTWLSDTTFTRETKEESLKDTQTALDRLRTALGEADNLFLTLGTNHTYRLRSTGEVVVNCHKHPQREFSEEVQGVEEMTEALDNALLSLRKRNPRLTVTLTVSPYRYTKYGMHESNLSKATLLLTVEALCRRHPLWVQYFPAYELVVDELRDYRFYADDMLHPSPVAVRYVWQRLHEWMGDDMLEYLRRWKPIAQVLSHRPLHPERPEWRRLAERTDGELECLQCDYPMLPIIHNQ